jgi:eukaryotic-like serine/threonine-protein kinase
VAEGDTSQLVAGRYKLDERVGSGSFGDVWRATDLLLARPVAVKLLRTELAADQDAARRFRAEAHHAGSLSHEAITRVYDYDDSGAAGTPFLVMEYVDGPSVASVLVDGPMAPAAVMDLVAQVASGLSAAHQTGLVHRDIKPHNLLFDADGNVKITDFGVSAAVGDAAVTATGWVVRTPEYLAPERLEGQRGDARSDLYSLGIVAYQCLTGRLPFSGPAMEVAQAHLLEPLPPLAEHIPVQASELVLALTAKDPMSRPLNAAAVAEMARRARDDLTGPRVPLDDLPVPDVPAPDVPAPRVSVPEVPVPEVPMQDVPGPHESVPGARPFRSPTLWQPLPRADASTRSRRPWVRYGRLAVAAAGVTLAAWLLVSFLNPTPQPATPAQAATTVEVSASALHGQKVTLVAARLRRLGLTVVVRWRETGQVAAGRVVSVQPAGRRPAGSKVVVVGALRLPPGSDRTGNPGNRKKAPHHGTPRHGSRPSRGPQPSVGPTLEPSPTASPPPGSPTPSASPPPSATPPPSDSPSPDATQAPPSP